MKSSGLATCVPLMLLGAQLALAQAPSPNRDTSGAASVLLPAYNPLLAESSAALYDAAHGAPAGLPLPKHGGWVTVTKWATLAAAAGLGVLGFSLHNDADALFDQLEEACQADPDTCQQRNPDGSYTDPTLERLYQDTRTKDQQARISLIASQLFFGTSVLLFIVDFQKGGDPSDIPYDPESERSAFRLTAQPGELALRYYFR